MGSFGEFITDPFGTRRAARAQEEANEQAARAAEQARIEREEALAREQAAQKEAIEKKEAAIRDIPIPTFLETPEAQKLKGTLEERIAGRGLINIDKLSAPFAEQRRAGLKEQTIPLIGAESSARGVGRSTIPVNRIAAESRAAERDIESRVAQLQLVQEEQKQTALSSFQTLAETESKSQQQKAILERGGQFDVADTIIKTADDLSDDQIRLANTFRDDQFALSNAIAQSGADNASRLMREAELATSLGLGIFEGYTNVQASETLAEAIRAERNDRSAAQVNIGNTDVGTGRA